jgi:tRNA pseudouridine55 synthase
MNGILNVLKPPGMTSFDVTAYLRGLTRVKKIGHTGTLDPGAAGVLPICIGNAARAIEYIADKDKQYRAELTLGITTDTQDCYGNIISKQGASIHKTKIKEALESFKGSYSQIPPMYSAVKIGGKKLYEMARKGIEIERKPRNVEIYSIEIIEIKDSAANDCFEIPTIRVLFDVKCSKGTYIRTLCADAGERLGCGGHMSFLVRTEAAGFNIMSALTLEDIKKMAQDGTLENALIRVDKVFDGYDMYELKEEEERKFLNGAFLELSGKGFSKGTLVRIYGSKGKFLALGEVISREGKLLLKSKKRFI